MVEMLIVLGVVATAAAAGFAWACLQRGRTLAKLRAQCTHLEMSLAAAKRSLLQVSSQGCEREIAIAALNDSLARSGSQIEQLRDMVKIHVARRREFDEWAGPIRSLLGEGISRIVQELKDRLARQEFTMRRQDRVVAEVQDQYRGKRDEIEQLRQELTLKNYHIAALNERFIRIEERMRDLSSEIYAQPAPEAAEPPPTLSGADAPTQLGPPRPRGSESPETERFSLDRDAGKDWMGVLDDWQRQLQARFERLDELQARVRGNADKSEPPPEREREDPAA